MCGIVGCHSTNAELNDGILDISRALNSITHRGPDDFGTFIDGQVALGHRRLSIIDLSKSGHQPMKSSNGRFTIVFNGEIYNFKQLRATLQDEGVSFIGNSDTEVLVNAYQQWGKDALKLLNGIFAFAIWDNVERSLLLARDRMGVKPLYFYYNSGLLRFGSEIKAILLQRGVDSRIAPQGFHEFLYYGNPLGETTLFA
ncbi:MAG: asparagine synthetase B family protein, partial [bacterium]